MLVLVVAIGAGYLALARRRDGWPASRTVAALGAILALVATGLLGDASFTRHMVGHVLAGMVAPFLLALSAPVTLVLQAGRPATRSAIRRALHSRLARVLTRPAVGFVLFGSSIVALYLTSLLDVADEHSVVHVLVHLHLFIVGTLFLWPLVGADALPRPLGHGARLLVVLAAVPFHAFVSVALLTASEPVAPDAYPALSDQRCAAGVLWASGELMSLCVAAVVFRRWMAADRRDAARADRRLAAPAVPTAPAG